MFYWYDIFMPITICSRGSSESPGSTLPAVSPQLKASACSIYQTYLACSAPFAVNITDTAKNQTQDLESPTPDMFDKAQSQVCPLQPSHPPTHPCHTLVVLPTLELVRPFI